MKRAGLVSQGTLTRLRQTARAAFERGDIKNCVETLKRATQLAPADVSILLQLGRMQGLLYNYQAAQEAFEKAIRVAPASRKAEALAGAGQQARDFYNPTIAETYFKRAVEEKGATPDMLVKMAEFCERRRKMEEAASLVEQALQLDGQCSSARLARGRLSFRAGNLEVAEQTLRPLLDLSINPEVRVRAGYQLGAVLDRQGRFDEAMSAFLGAKALLRSDGAPHFAQLRIVRAHVAQMRAEITREQLERWSKLGSELHPPQRLTLLGGHPRSGTTLLEQVLDSHPDIISAEETNHFSEYVYLPLKRQWPELTPILKVLNAASTEALGNLRNDYLRASEQCLGGTLEGRMLIDKNPSLTFMIPAIARAFPESRFLIALRDPRDVVLSCFMQPFVPVHQVSSAYLNLETAAEEYAALMGMWRTLAPLLQNPWLEVRYEDMVEDLESVARKALEFLEMPWDERVLGFDEHARSKLVRSPTYADVTQKVFKRAKGRWRNYQKFLEPHLHILEPFVKAYGYE